MTVMKTTAYIAYNINNYCGIKLRVNPLECIVMKRIRLDSHQISQNLACSNKLPDLMT
jgi:hypothetical protein